MTQAFRATIYLLALSLILIGSAPAQSQSAPNPNASSEVNELAAALVGAGSEQQEDRLLAQKKELVDGSLLAALKSLSESRVNKGEYTEAVRISRLAVRVAEKTGNRALLGNALCDLGSVMFWQNRSAEGLEHLQKSLAIFEETGDKKGKARALYNARPRRCRHRDAKPRTVLIHQAQKLTIRALFVVKEIIHVLPAEVVVSRQRLAVKLRIAKPAHDAGVVRIDGDDQVRHNAMPQTAQDRAVGCNHNAIEGGIDQSLQRTGAM